MEDYRYRLIQIEAQYQNDAVQSDDEDEQFEDDSSFDDNTHVIPATSDLFNNVEIESDSSFDEHIEHDDDEEGEDYYEEEGEDDELLFPVVRMLHRDGIEDDEYEDYEEEEEEEEYEELFPVAVEMTSSARVSSEEFSGGMLLGGMVSEDDGVVEDSDESEESCEGKEGGRGKCGGEISGSVCPVCFEAWTSGGEHQICCLPCGHIYGLSCIKKWLQQSGGSGKCPQCNNVCTFKDVRVLYTSRLCVADEELQKRVRSLEAKCAYLEQKAGSLTPDELIDQICSNPAAVQRLATVLAGLHQQPVSP